MEANPSVPRESRKRSARRHTPDAPTVGKIVAAKASDFNRETTAFNKQRAKLRRKCGSNGDLAHPCSEAEKAGASFSAKDKTPTIWWREQNNRNILSKMKTGGHPANRMPLTSKVVTPIHSHEELCSYVQLFSVSFMTPEASGIQNPQELKAAAEEALVIYGASLRAWKRRTKSHRHDGTNSHSNEKSDNTLKGEQSWRN